MKAVENGAGKMKPDRWVKMAQADIEALLNIHENARRLPEPLSRFGLVNSLNDKNPILVRCMNTQHRRRVCVIREDGFGTMRGRLRPGVTAIELLSLIKI
jgi:hypothetical protein